MNPPCKNSDELGAINVGYPITFIPKREFPTEEENPKRPLVGFDVYRMKERTQGMQPEEKIAAPVPGDTFLRWRHSEACYYPTDLELTGELVGGKGTQGEEGLSIPFEDIVEELTLDSVVFHEPDEKE